MTKFTKSNVTDNGYIICLKKELVVRELYMHKHNLQETRSGYGAKLTSHYMINYEGRLYRIYVTQFSNCGTAWFTTCGRHITVSAH